MLHAARWESFTATGVKYSIFVLHILRINELSLRFMFSKSYIMQIGKSLRKGKQIGYYYLKIPGHVLILNGFQCAIKLLVMWTG